MFTETGEGTAFRNLGAETRYREQQPTGSTPTAHNISDLISSSSGDRQIHVDNPGVNIPTTYDVYSDVSSFFTKQDAYYECNSMHYYEVLPPDLE